jgi:transposase InsO family protein
VHVCIDDCTRLAYVEVLDDERKETVTAFLGRAVAWFAGHGVIIRRPMTDNGSGYRSTLHRRACHALGIRHLFTRPYRPRTNGKAERFIRTLLAGWAYHRPYATSAERHAALAAFLTTTTPSARTGRSTARRPPSAWPSETRLPLPTARRWRARPPSGRARSAGAGRSSRGCA